MGNMFKCVLASGTGNGIPLIVTCTSAFAGLTITCTDGTTTLTDTCPSSSPYEITFNLPNTGTWIVSGTISGQTFTTTITVTDETALLSDIPDGATVTPTDDVQILLNCANIWDKAYTTISQLLADTTSLLAVISDNNAVDYLVRSTTFASDICADSTAMTYIGADDYCADTLLSDSTWCMAICNSTYFESVLNVKVPTMTSNTTPSGTASASSALGSYPAWKAFDGSDSTHYNEDSSSGTGWIKYQFATSVKVYRIRLYSSDVQSHPERFNTFTYSAGSTDIASKTSSQIKSNNIWIIGTSASLSDSHQIKWTKNGSQQLAVDTLQFWGR